MKSFYLTILFIASSFYTFSQNQEQLIKVFNVSTVAIMNAIPSPFAGNIIYVTENSRIYYFDGTSWLPLGGPSDGWNMFGNAGTNPLVDFLGTNDNQDLRLRTTDDFSNNAPSVDKVIIKSNKYQFLFGSASGFNGFFGQVSNFDFTFTAGNQYSSTNALGASFDLNNNQSINLSAGSSATGNNQAINFYSDNQFRATILGNGNFGINTPNPSSRFHIREKGFSFIDGNEENGKALTSDANGNAAWHTISGENADGWGLNGNTGTNPSIFYLGTNDNQPIVFRTNNTNVWSIETNGRIQNYTNNIAIGDNQTFNPSGSGIRNIALGQSALTSNTSGSNNVAIGKNILEDNIGGGNNVAIGDQALRSNVNSSNNIGIGTSALGSNNSGNNNIGIGMNALLSNNNGSNNTAVGVNALKHAASGSNNCAIGANAFSNSSTAYNNSTAIGANVNISSSNQIRIGDNVVSIGGPVGWSIVSDKRFKENISQDVKGLDFILGLNPVTYNINFKAIDQHEREKKDTLTSEKSYQKLYRVRHVGFLAQEVEALADSLDFDFHGVDKPENKEGIYGLRYAEFVPSIVKTLQEQQEILASRKEAIDKQQLINRQRDNSIKELIKRVEELKK